LGWIGLGCGEILGGGGSMMWCSDFRSRGVVACCRCSVVVLQFVVVVGVVVVVFVSCFFCS